MNIAQQLAVMAAYRDGYPVERAQLRAMPPDGSSAPVETVPPSGHQFDFGHYTYRVAQRRAKLFICLSRADYDMLFLGGDSQSKSIAVAKVSCAPMLGGVLLTGDAFTPYLPD